MKQNPEIGLVHGNVRNRSKRELSGPENEPFADFSHFDALRMRLASAAVQCNR